MEGGLKKVFLTLFKTQGTEDDDLCESQQIEQALRKFSETAKGWYWNMEKLEIMLSELKISGK